MTFRFTYLFLLLATSLLWLTSCVITTETQPLRYVPSTDLAIPPPAQPINTIYRFFDCQKDMAEVLKNNIIEVEDELERDMENINFSDMNCYAVSTSKEVIDDFYDNMTTVVKDASYELTDEASLSVIGSDINIEFWESREKTKVLIYSGIGYFLVMNLVE